jgi:hypothetical protein
MKISKEALKEIIREEIEALTEQEKTEPSGDFGKQRKSRGAASAGLKQRSKDMQSQKGVDDLERGIINQIEDLLTKLADKTDIKGGAVNSKLKKLYSILQQELGEETNEE